ncbi:MAG: helix-turn-helix domain-containing protein [Propionibacteriaceae bacterium]
MLFRELIGESLREERMAQGKTLREISTAARVSLGYLSEVERGQKEASSELLAAICGALHTPLSVVLNVVSEKMFGHEQAVGREPISGEKVMALPLRPMPRAAAA